MRNILEMRLTDRGGNKELTTRFLQYTVLQGVWFLDTGEFKTKPTKETRNTYISLTKSAMSKCLQMVNHDPGLDWIC